MKGSLSAAIAVISLFTVVPQVAWAAPLVRGLGGPADFGVDRLEYNDDGSTGEIDVSAAFPEGLFFFGMSFTSLYLNNNGNITFGGPLGTYTPSPFPIASQRMIAPWWGDVDTRGEGAPTRNGVYWSITPGRFVATWHNVGYYGIHDDLQNDFQLLLTRAGPGVGDFDVEFRYNRCEWTTGDASGGSGGFGGTPAQAGFDAGNLTDYVSLPGSRTMDVLRLCFTTNVRDPGVWRFEIRGGDVMCPGRGEACEMGLPGVCNAGTRRCVSPDESVCMSNVGPSPEVCNGLDDDCNGPIDELLGETTCGVGVCVATVPNCVGGIPQTCVPGEPRDEICNFLDDDCNELVDDAPDQFCGFGLCQRMTAGCVDGRIPVCVPGEPEPETCNGIDDDCNMLVDDTLDACFAIPDSGVDSGGRDGGRLDAGRIDAARCIGSGCNPYRLEGRAGPIGCNCRAGTATPPSAGALVLLAVLGALGIRRRRSAPP